MLITIWIDGYLYDAEGIIYEPQLLAEFEPHQNEDLIVYEEEFKHQKVVSTEIVEAVKQIYRDNIPATD